MTRRAAALPHAPERAAQVVSVCAVAAVARDGCCPGQAAAVNDQRRTIAGEVDKLSVAAEDAAA